MADHTSIEWADATWNPITGCMVYSPGCKNCYAMKLAGTRLKHHHSRVGLTVDTKAGPVWNGEVRLNEEWLDQPLRWAKPRMIFVCAHADLFYEKVPDAWIDRVFAAMALSPRHVFQVLTKRSDRASAYLNDDDTPGRIALAADVLWATHLAPGDKGYLSVHPRYDDDPDIELSAWPLPNVWLGTSVEDQARADERRQPMQKLAEAGWLTWVSYEPALEMVDWTGWEFIRWMVSGGESDMDGESARPTHPEWHRGARDFCAPRDIAYLFKQWGCWIDIDQFAARIAAAASTDEMWIVRDGVRWTPTLPLNYADAAWLAEFIGHRSEHQSDGRTLLRMKKSDAGRLLDGVEHNGYPRDLIRPVLPA